MSKNKAKAKATVVDGSLNMLHIKAILWKNGEKDWCGKPVPDSVYVVITLSKDEIKRLKKSLGTKGVSVHHQTVSGTAFLTLNP